MTPEQQPIHTHMALEEWRTALTGLCVGNWPASAKEAHDNVKGRIQRLQDEIEALKAASQRPPSGGLRFKIVVAPDLPEGELHLVGPDGKLLGKLIGVTP